MRVIWRILTLHEIVSHKKADKDVNASLVECTIYNYKCLFILDTVWICVNIIDTKSLTFLTTRQHHVQPVVLNS